MPTRFVFFRKRPNATVFALIIWYDRLIRANAPALVNRRYSGQSTKTRPSARKSARRWAVGGSGCGRRQTAGGRKGRRSGRRGGRQAARQQESRAAPRALRQEGAKRAPVYVGLPRRSRSDRRTFRNFCCRYARLPRASRAARRCPQIPTEDLRSVPFSRLQSPAALCPPPIFACSVGLPHRSPKRSRNATETQSNRTCPSRLCQRCGTVFGAYKLCAPVLHLTKSNKCCIIYINYLRTGSARRQRTDVPIPTNTVDKNIF